MPSHTPLAGKSNGETVEKGGLFGGASFGNPVNHMNFERKVENGGPFGSSSSGKVEKDGLGKAKHGVLFDGNI